MVENVLNKTSCVKIQVKRWFEMYRYISIKTKLTGEMKEDYAEILNEYLKDGYELVSMVPMYRRRYIPHHYDLIFKKM